MVRVAPETRQLASAMRRQSSGGRKSLPSSVLYERHVGNIEVVGGIGAEEFKSMNKMLQRLDRFWNDTIAYRM